MKLGFIGCGNMANAMIAGIIGNGICKAEEIIGTAKSEESRVRAVSYTHLERWRAQSLLQAATLDVRSAIMCHLFLGQGRQKSIGKKSKNLDFW